MALISFDAAKSHLRIHPDDTSHDVEVLAKMEQASAMVINYLKRPDHGWDVDTDPTADEEFAITQAAIFEVLANLFNDHGDREKPTPGPITDRVRVMLVSLRDPALA
jgi:hypothetical protein